MARATTKELTVTLVFTGKTRKSLDAIVDGMSFPTLAAWAETVRIRKWIARDLTLHPYPKKTKRTK